MADPTTSAQPVALAGSDNWLVGGVGAIVRGIKNICDWIGGLTPAGASVYDTGWVTTGYTAQNSSVITAFSIRRIGNTVSIIIDGTSGTIAVPVSGDNANAPVVIVPSGFIPSRGQALTSRGAILAANIDTAGNVNISAILPVVTATGATTQTWSFNIGGTYFLG